MGAAGVLGVQIRKGAGATTPPWVIMNRLRNLAVIRKAPSFTLALFPAAALFVCTLIVLLHVSVACSLGLFPKPEQQLMVYANSRGRIGSF